jgi:spermidine/putrescine transport system ATP-binding protein
MTLPAPGVENVPPPIPGQSGSVHDLIVQVIDVSKRFGTVQALSTVNLAVRRGEFLTLLGPSGCGKSTLLRIVAGLAQPSEGRIFVDGRDVTDVSPERRPTNMVFQRHALFPHLNVFDNVAFALRLRRVGKDEISAIVSRMLRLVDLEELSERLPHELSGGQAQRVALARALVNKPKVLLLDEPLSALDRKIRQYMQEELRTIQQKLETTFVYVTHDQEEAMSMSERIALMRDGHIEQVGTPTELYRKPASEFAAAFVGDANFLTGEAALGPSGVLLRWGGMDIANVDVGSHRPGDMVRFVVRPDAVRLSPLTGGAPPAGPVARVLQSDFLGFHWVHRVELGTEKLIARETTREPGVSVGMMVTVWLDGEDVSLLSPAE